MGSSETGETGDTPSPRTWGAFSLSTHDAQALAPSIAGAAKQGNTEEGGGDDVRGRLYSENEVAALKGYCGVVNPAGIPTNWDSFQQTREIASHRHNLRVGVSQWSKITGKDIDKAPFFTKQMVKDIVGLNFNPGEAVPTFTSAQRGISILTCCPNRHTKSKPSRFSRRQGGQWPTRPNSRKCGADKRHRPAHLQTTTSNYD